ncbi:MAG: RbsD/FucU family protein [Nitriliruptoraceae bacterium]|nr:RbsD/FucU family protein [Nitriliruptoraceae bacterium]
MLNGQLLHPEILRVLGRCGHGSRILIADGNYPFATQLGPNAELVSLNLSPGVVDAPTALQALLSAIPIEATHVMRYDTSGPYGLAEDPPVWADFRRLLGDVGYEGELEQVERFAFYDMGMAPNVALTIATAEQATWANILLTVGVVMPGEGSR